MRDGALPLWGDDDEDLELGGGEDQEGEETDSDFLEALTVPDFSRKPLPGMRRPARLLTQAEEEELVKRMEQGDEKARQLLIEANQRLVYSVANRYRHSGVPLEDLIQEGFIGLIRAVDTFDRRRRCRFSTHAMIWIRSAVLQAIQQFKPLVHVPQRVAAAAKKLWRLSEELTYELQRPPTPEELAFRSGLSVERVKELLEVAQDWVSLEEAVHEEGETSFLDLVADEQALEPRERVRFNYFQECIEKGLEQLTERERQVIQMRFGLGGEREHTLAEIGQRLHLSRQRIKGIETEALEKLRCQDCPQLQAEQLCEETLRALYA